MAYLAAMQRCCHADAWGKERVDRGHCLPRSGHRGTAARLLDGSTLTRWGTRTPVRGRRRRRGSLLHCFVVACWLLLR